MLTDKQKEALKVVLELHRDSKMKDEQVLTVIEAFNENTPTLTSVPCSPICPELQPWITYKVVCGQEIK